MTNIFLISLSLLNTLDGSNLELAFLNIKMLGRFDSIKLIRGVK